MSNDRQSDNSENKLTKDDFFEAFGKNIPMEAVQIVWGGDPNRTMSQVRDELRALAERLKTRPSAAQQMPSEEAMRDLMQRAQSFVVTRGTSETSELVGELYDLVDRLTALLPSSSEAGGATMHYGIADRKDMQPDVPADEMERIRQIERDAARPSAPSGETTAKVGNEVLAAFVQEQPPADGALSEDFTEYGFEWHFSDGSKFWLDINKDEGIKTYWRKGGTERGQVSDIPIARARSPAAAPKFAKTFCSQCGGEFGPGDHGYSHCQDHARALSPAAADGGEWDEPAIRAAARRIATGAAITVRALEAHTPGSADTNNIGLEAMIYHEIAALKRPPLPAVGEED